MIGSRGVAAGIASCFIAAVLSACGTSDPGGAIPTELDIATENSGSTSPTTDVPALDGSADTTPPPRGVAPRVTGELAGTIVAIDPGHNGANAAHPAEINRKVDAGNGVIKECDTTGTASSDGWPEYEFNLTFAEQVRLRLETAGATVVMTRTDSTGWGPCITERAASGNAAAADVAVSIHADGNDGSGARGFHVIVPTVTAGGPAVTAASARFGQELRDAMTGTGMPPSTYLGEAGIDTRGDLGGLNLSTVPKAFLEAGNMRNPTDEALLADPAWRAGAAEAVVAAIVAFISGG